ncbi:hypothetical protein AMBR_FBHANALA_01473 [Dolosigranulum pigrum]|nr:hypothetical protein AMBR_FBHANALA_01473 [Dolosigranulum pigrum]
MQGIEPPYTDPYVRWCERSTSQLMASLLLDFQHFVLVITNIFSHLNDKVTIPIFIVH